MKCFSRQFPESSSLCLCVCSILENMCTSCIIESKGRSIKYKKNNIRKIKMVQEEIHEVHHMLPGYKFIKIKTKLIINKKPHRILLLFKKYSLVFYNELYNTTPPLLYAYLLHHLDFFFNNHHRNNKQRNLISQMLSCSLVLECSLNKVACWLLYCWFVWGFFFTSIIITELFPRESSERLILAKYGHRKTAWSLILSPGAVMPWWKISVSRKLDFSVPKELPTILFSYYIYLV